MVIRSSPALIVGLLFLFLRNYRGFIYNWSGTRMWRKKKRRGKETQGYPKSKTWDTGATKKLHPFSYYCHYYSICPCVCLPLYIYTSIHIYFLAHLVRLPPPTQASHPPASLATLNIILFQAEPEVRQCHCQVNTLHCLEEAGAVAKSY